MLVKRIKQLFRDERGMELVQVAILVAIAIAVGLFFKQQIGDFVKEIFDGLNAKKFNGSV